MRTHRLLTTSHERRRLALWALTMLAWIAAVLFAGKTVTPRQLRTRHHRISLERLTQMVIHLVIVRSCELAPRRPRRLCFFRHGRDLKRRHYIRSLLGARLRRALKPKALGARIEALIRVLLQLDAYALQLSKRRLTRLWGAKPALALAAFIPDATPQALAFADSS